MAKNHKNFDNLPYRHCVGIVVLNGEGKVWTGRRIDEDNGELTNAQQLWQLPQGGIDKDEEPLAAAKRELYEETGIKSVSLLEEAPEWIYYDLPEELLGVARKANTVARRSAGLPFGLKAMKMKLPSIRHPRATRRNLTSGNGELCRTYPT